MEWRLTYIALGVSDQIVDPVLRGENGRSILGIGNDPLSYLFGSLRSHG
jgi:hypothetical protein